MTCDRAALELDQAELHLLLEALVARPGPKARALKARLRAALAELALGKEAQRRGA
jgi:hypothetical protein